MEDSTISRVPPHSIEAEQSVIGSMLLDPAAIETASEILSPDDFYQRQYGVIYEAILELYNEGAAVDVVSLQDRLRGKDLPPEVNTVAAFRELLNMVPTSANVRYYAQIVYNKSLLRRLIRASEEIATDCYAEKEEIAEICETTEKKVFNILDRRKTQEFEPIGETVLKVIDKIEKASRQKSSVTGIATGFTDLDRQTSGMQPSDFIIVAARPSMGKTAFTLNIASYIGLHGGTVAFFSLEMSKSQLMQRLMAAEGLIDSQRLRTGELSVEEWTNLVSVADKLSHTNIYIDDTPGITVRELRSKARRLKAEHGLDIIIIDYLQLMQGRASKNNDSRQQEVSEISRSLKALARELDVPVIALSQLSRSVESRQVKRPMLSDLRESGSLEQDADIVMFLYREDYYDKDTENQGVTELILAKHRNGAIGTVNLMFQKQYTRFQNLLMQ